MLQEQSWKRQALSYLWGDLLNASVSNTEVLLRIHLDYEGCLTLLQVTSGDKLFHTPSLSIKRGQGQSRQLSAEGIISLEITIKNECF